MKFIVQSFVNFTFATSSELWGGSYGKHPVKLYNGINVLIYQDDNGDGYSGKKPNGGVISWWTLASSMSVVVANPITYYDNLTISQVGQSGDLYNYYWTSYSRGTDGGVDVTVWISKPNWHNLYLDSYIPLKHKSIYDPCPYGYRIPSNGTYNEFTSTGWRTLSYVGGVAWNQCWFSGSGRRSCAFVETAVWGLYYTSTSSLERSGYLIGFTSSAGSMHKNWHERSRHLGNSVRCIEECELLPDATEASAGKFKMRELKTMP